MRMRYHGAAAALLLLSGCGPRIDDSSNLPRLGQWHREVRLVALVINDVWVDRKDSPFKIPDDIDETKDCAEPTITRREEIDAEIKKQTDNLCRIESIDHNGTTIMTKGSCGPEQKDNLTLSGTAELEGHEAEDRIDSHATIQMLVRLRDGHSERVRAGYEAHLKRLGGCR